MTRRTAKPYTEECKHEAVTLVTEQHMSRTQVARDLGVSIDTLARWVRASRPSSAATDDPPASSTATELARLRRELERVQMERDILKKALGIFSQMPR